MKILFLTVINIETIYEKGIYQDLLREFVKHGHSVYIISPYERRCKKETQILTETGCTILKVKMGNIQKTNVIEKGISTVLLEHQFLAMFKKKLINIKFDIVLYHTPPITFGKIIKYVKKKDGAKSYLLLKDIFPQNAVDLGMLSLHGIKGILYRYFRRREKELYMISDFIGCMSQANVDYILKHNSFLDSSKVHISPNCVELCEKTKIEKNVIRKKYDLPLDRTIFIYGGNLGKPQGVPFIVDCLKMNQRKAGCYFVICGTGTDYGKLEEYTKREKPENVRVLNGLPKKEYEELVSACDVGMIFLNYKFTIPNFPSRLLTYMEQSLPILACTDKATDLSEVIEKEKLGWWCESKSFDDFNKLIDNIVAGEIDYQLGNNSYSYMKRNFQVSVVYEEMCSYLSARPYFITI